METLLTIAGFDPSSGAGVTADLAVFAAHEYFGTSCITALTVQSTQGVRSATPVPSSVIRDTLACLEDDLPPAGIKIGMLGQLAAVEAVAGYLRALRMQGRRPMVVLDPVIRSTSGHALLELEALRALREHVLPHVDWVTPNVQELLQLGGVKTTEAGDLHEAAKRLQAEHPALGVLVTGGDRDPPDDLLVPPAGPAMWVRGGARLETTSTHGTGCALSSSFLCQLVRGGTPFEAARAAKAYVYRAIQTAPGLGQGHGPMNLLWPLKENDVLP